MIKIFGMMFDRISRGSALTRVEWLPRTSREFAFHITEVCDRVVMNSMTNPEHEEAIGVPLTQEKMSKMSCRKLP
jgi:hypothetical protein